MILLPLNEKIPTRPNVPGGFALVGGSQGLGSVFNERNIVLSAGLQHGLNICTLAIEMNQDDGLGQISEASTLVEEGLEQGGVQIPGGAIAVNKNGFSPQVANRACPRQ